MTLHRMLAAVALCISSASCVSYSSIQKADKEIYLSGATNYFVITVPFLKRCDADGQVLHCEELKEFEAPRSGRGGASTPAAEPASTSAPAAPAATPAKK